MSVLYCRSPTLLFITLVLVFIPFQNVLCQCSGSVLTLTPTVDIQYLQSPGYASGSGTYDSNLSCSWIIDGGSASWRIVLYVKNYDITCSGDVINIYDGTETSNTTLASNLCGSGSSSVLYRSSQQYVRVGFTTDSTNQAVGFEIAYFKATDFSDTGCTSAQTLTASTTEQYLTSPSFPSNYDTSANCEWTIKASSGTLLMEIIFSDIELSTSCSFDGLTIYDGDYVCASTLLATICSQYPNGVAGTYTSNQTAFLLKFKSDGSLSYSGFILKYYIQTETNTVSPGITINYTDDKFQLGLAIGFSGGASGAFIIIVVAVLIKQKCRTSKMRKNRSHVHRRSSHITQVTPAQTPTLTDSSSDQSDDLSKRHPYV